VGIISNSFIFSGTSLSSLPGNELAINNNPFHQRALALTNEIRRERERKERGEGVSDPNDETLDDDAQIVVYNAPQDDPQDDPQGIRLNEGNHDSNREVQVDPQPLPALSHQAATSNNETDDVNEHKIDKRAHHDSETHIQVPGSEVPRNWRPPTTSFLKRELNNKLDLSQMGYKVWSPSNPRGEQVFDDNGILLGVDSDEEDYSLSQSSPPNICKSESIKENDDPKMPALVPQDQNQYAALAEDSDEDEETPHTDTSPLTNPPHTGAPPANTTQHGSLDGSSKGSVCSYASVAGTNSVFANVNGPPIWTHMAPLPDEGMRQQRLQESDKTGKREHPLKDNFKSRQQSGRKVNTPKSATHTASDFCGDILSPFLGDRYKHRSSEEVSPANSKDSDADTKPPAHPDFTGDTQTGGSPVTSRKAYRPMDQRVTTPISISSRRLALHINLQA